MAAIDLPPVIGLQGDSRHAFVSRPRPRRLAAIALFGTVILGARTWWLASRSLDYRYVASIFVMPMVFVMLASVGYAIRRARVWLDAGGVRWGWSLATIRVEPKRLRQIHIYTDGIALAIGRGSPWFLARRDWANFDGLVRDSERSGFPVVIHKSRAPWRARVQAYGRVLDGLMFASLISSATALILVSS